MIGKKNQCQGGNNNATLCQAVTHYYIIDYFNLTSQQQVFYSLHTMADSFRLQYVMEGAWLSRDQQ